MKKQFLILFAFISVLALSQVPQRFNKVIVTGDITSPKYIVTNSNNDSVLLGAGGRRAISTIKTDTVSLSNRINAKQETLVSGTNIRTVNGNSVLGSGDIQIASGGGGSPVNIYLSNVNSTVSGYKEARPNIDVAETVKAITATPANTITWGEKYLYTSPVSTTIIPSGFWELHAYGHISTSTGVSKLVFRVLRYSAGIETVLATFTGFEVNNITDAEMSVNGSTNDIAVLAGDYLGIQVGFLSDGASPARTLTYTIGDGHASHFNTPLPTRHSTLRDKNGEADFQHLTTAQVTKVNNTSGINTGDETLTSIKTKLGAATAVSDGYLKYQDFALLHTPTTVTASNGLSISGQNISLQNASLTQSGALTFNDWNTFNSKEPAITKNSGFNKPLGNTPGTVLEGRTFGTAANSAVGDFIQNQNSSEQSANLRISGSGIFGSYVSSSKVKSFLSAQTALRTYTKEAVVEISAYQSTIGSPYTKTTDIVANADAGASSQIRFLTTTSSGPPMTALLLSDVGTATFSSTVNSTGFLLNGNNLTSSLTTNYLPKWNGSTMVNAIAGADYQLPITLTTNGTSGAATFSGNVLNVPNYTNNAGGGSYSPSISVGSNTANPVVYSALYTKNGTVYSSVIKGYIECTGSQGNTCTFNVSTYNGSTANLSIIGVGAQGTNMILGSGSTGSNVVVSFTNPVGSGGIGFTLIVHYTN